MRSSHDKISAASGVRYSEMCRLPYWDPTRMVPIDLMHFFHEGIVAAHFPHVPILSNNDNGDRDADDADAAEAVSDIEETLDPE